MKLSHRRLVLSLAVLGLATLVLLLAGGLSAGPPGGGVLDHYRGYPISAATALDGPIVQITDQFGTQTTDLGQTVRFLVPVDKNDEGITDRISHLTCYRILDGNPAPPVISTNQFGAQLLTLGAPESLCVPTEKLITPGPVLLDHYKCYLASGQPVDAGVALVDQFQQSSALVLNPRLFCAPADKNGEPVLDPVTHLTCYDTDPPGLPPGPVPILNQFLADNALIDLQEPNLLCVPSTKEIRRLDHFTVYDATGPPGPFVTVEDQFYTQKRQLGDTKFFMVPADKNFEGILDPFSHLTCYDMGGNAPGHPNVMVTNQFVTDARIDVGLPTELCVPTEKLIAPGPVDIDHYKCYEATAPPVDIPLTLADQFQGFSTLVVDTIRLCNPASKNGEPIQNPDDHLVCYKLSPPGGVLGAAIPTSNQFFDTSIDLGAPVVLCAPSTKTLPEPGVTTGIASGLLLLAALERRRRRRAGGGD